VFYPRNVIRKPVVTIYVRHSPECPNRNQKNSTFYRGCDCTKWLRYSGDACFCKGASVKLKPHRQHKLAADTRSWTVAEDKRAELQARLDAGEITPLPATPNTKRKTIAQALETFITAKESENISKTTIRKLRHQLGRFERFMAVRGKHFPSEIEPADLIDFRAGWASWKSGVTKQKAQQNLRGFLRSCCVENLQSLLKALGTIKLTKADSARLEPKPFTDEEVHKLIAQVPKTFPGDQLRIRRMPVLIRFMVATGLAIRDTIQLEREHIAGGWLRIKRQKTGKAVTQRLDPNLHQELLAVADKHKYVFWNGTSMPTSATGLWQADLRTVMEDAELLIPGNLSHRFRDTAVDYWLAVGCTIVEVAALLGDTPTIVEKHYASLVSNRMQDRLAKLPVRSWAQGASQ
jgi:integrase